MFCDQVKKTFSECFKYAENNQHDSISVEHLLLMLLNNPDARDVLEHYDVDLDTIKKNIEQYIDQNTEKLKGKSIMDIKPTMSFQRVLQRAIFQVQAMDRLVVSGANVLAAIFNESATYAASALCAQNISRLDVLNFISNWKGYKCFKFLV
jgi:ATP-dependent Clp protease ATP-binding subunit ClpA